MPTRRRIPLLEGRAAVAEWFNAQRDCTLRAFDPDVSEEQAEPGSLPAVDRAVMATAVRYTLEELTARAPGQALEVRVPPFGATQCIKGPRHTRGTPPGVVEMSPQTWLEVATGSREWGEALASGDVSASGERANLSDLLPLTEERP
ncbi:sterol carrier family protein [Demequina oxidasica]|uniref:sterol carrier family protein n=1 Tax=Demequina oxidasica TaxID=676199 RepID=UPI0007814FB7|nr:sterol carrier family protein [Demequina oxidasica]